MELIDNISRLLGDNLKQTLKLDVRLKIGETAQFNCNIKINALLLALGFCREQRCYGASV